MKEINVLHLFLYGTFNEMAQHIVMMLIVDRSITGVSVLCYVLVSQDQDISLHPRGPCIFWMCSQRTRWIFIAVPRGTDTQGRPDRATVRGYFYRVRSLCVDVKSQPSLLLLTNLYSRWMHIKQLVVIVLANFIMAIASRKKQQDMNDPLYWEYIVA